MKKNIVFLFFSFIVFFMCSCLSNNNSNIIDKGHWVKLNEGESIDGYTKIGNTIYGCYMDSIIDYHHFDSLTNVDVSTFEVCVGSGYARDKNHVYYPLRVVCVDAETWGGCYFEEYIIKKVSPNSFKYIKNGYAIDGNKMYFEGKEIKWHNDLLR